MNRVGRDEPFDVIPSVVPAKMAECVGANERVVPNDINGVAKRGCGLDVRFGDAQCEALEPSQTDAERLESFCFVVVELLEFVAIEAQNFAVRRESVVAALQRLEARDEAVAVTVEFLAQLVVVAE